MRLTGAFFLKIAGFDSGAVTCENYCFPKKYRAVTKCLDNKRIISRQESPNSQGRCQETDKDIS